MDALTLSKLRKHAALKLRAPRVAPLRIKPPNPMPASAPRATPRAAPAPAPAAPAPAAPAPTPAGPPAPPRSWGQFGKQNWKPLAAGGAVVGAAGALGPTGVGADLAWRAGMVNDPSRDLGHYTKDLETQRTQFQTSTIDPLMKQYEAAITSGDYRSLPALTKQLDEAHGKLQSNNFGTAARSRERAEGAWQSLQDDQGTKASWWKPLVGGYSNQNDAAQYDLANLKRHNMPTPMSLGQHDPATLALQYPSRYRANSQAGSWHPRQLSPNYASGSEGGGSSQYYNKLFRSAGLVQ